MGRGLGTLTAIGRKDNCEYLSTITNAIGRRSWTRHRQPLSPRIISSAPSIGFGMTRKFGIIM
jgi:hypothetical protein